MSDELPGRHPVTDRELQRIALEIAVGCIVWVLATVFLAQSQFDLVDWATYAVAFGGALVLALGIGWWRVIRHGPEARRGGSAACGALIMCVWLLVDAKDDDRALVWGVVFGLIGIVQYVRYLRYRDR